MHHTPTTAPAWQQDIFRVLKEGGVRQIAYVPDAGHSHVIRSAIADPDIEDVVLTTEEEGVAVVSGAWLGGQRAVLLMQSSGVGNCVNMFSLLRSANFPFFTLVTMRGEYAEFNPWQGPMGRATQGALELMGITVLRASRSGPGRGDRQRRLRRGVRGGRPGRGAAGAEPDRPQEVGAQRDDNAAPSRRVDRREFVARLLSALPDALVVTGLGSAVVRRLRGRRPRQQLLPLGCDGRCRVAGPWASRSRSRTSPSW